jgi:hypothetical protein
MNIVQRLRIATRLIYGDDLAIIADQVAPPSGELQRFADAITRNTQSALEGAQALQAGILDEVATQTRALNELSGRITSLERAQRDLLARIERGELRLHILDQAVGLARPATGD